MLHWLQKRKGPSLLSGQYLGSVSDLSWEEVVAAEPDAPVRMEWPDTPAREAEVFLVDGNNLAWKGFYAITEGLCRSDGLPTNALLGFANMLAKILSDYRPRGLVIAWDERPRRRIEMYEKYKAQRPPAPDAMKKQFPHFEGIATAFAAVNSRHADCEADDVLATLARQATEKGITACVVTNDRDAYQMVNDSVCILATPKGLTDVHVYTTDRVIARLGVRPDQVPDYLGLKGDPGDNIPGVPSFGEKTASELIARYGTLENVIAHSDEIKGKKREKLEENVEIALLSKRLATVESDLELECDLADVLATKRDFSGLVACLEEYEMFSLRDRLRRKGLA